MHGVAAMMAEFDQMVAGYDADLRQRVDLMICPPATLLSRLADHIGSSGMAVGGQNCHVERVGAHTGGISAEMIRDAGGSAVILGHSERRSQNRESNTLVAAKAHTALRAGLSAIICVGETEGERRLGRAEPVIIEQVTQSVPADLDPARLVIAYEPVWAIGSGRTPTPDEIAGMHAVIRRQLLDRFGSGATAVRILYGGSVNPGNARQLLGVADVGGALVGSASLKATDFMAIAHAAVAKAG